ITITGVASQRAKYKAVESCVVGGCLKSERADPASQTDFDRLGGLNLEIWVTFIEGVRRVMAAARKQFSRFGCALDVLCGNAADKIPCEVLEQADADALGRVTRRSRR